MASKEVTENEKAEKIAVDMAAVWVSALDGLMQTWLEQGRNNDRLGLALTSLRIAQVGLMLQSYFQEVGTDFLKDNAEVAEGQMAVANMQAKMRTLLQQAGIITSDPGRAPGLTGKPDRSAN